jgi:polysaccharide deacetylase family protein (PEP-CTERM system associated)
MTRLQPSRSRGVVNSLTFDVEDWFHGFGLPSSAWRHYQPRLSVGLSRILDILDAHRVKATFFILGTLVAEWRSILGLIADAGHEIAAHGYWHTPIYRLSPADFARDLHRVLEALRPIADRPIKSYRAPFFSITRCSLWALPILAEAGIAHDSSIVPAHNPRYGIPHANRFPHLVSTHQSHTNLTEFPISTISVGNVNLPFSGGFYGRLLPYRLIRRAVRRLNAGGQPAIFYFHPWELDPDQPRIADGVPALYRFTHYYRLGCTAAKLNALLRDFPFGPLSGLPNPDTTMSYLPLSRR